MSKSETKPKKREYPPPGLYRLSRDVKNPEPDRRVNKTYENDWGLLETWYQGRRFVILNRDAGDIAPGVILVEIQSGHRRSSKPAHRLPEELFAALEPTTPRNVSEAFWAVGLHDDNVRWAADQLVKKKVLTYDMLIAAARREEATDTQEDTLRKVLQKGAPADD